MADDPDMLDAFQDWMRKRGGLGAGSMPERVFFAGWLAARRAAPSSPVADDGLPKHFGLFNINGWDGHRIKGYTADQMRQVQREAYEAGAQAARKSAGTRMDTGFQAGAGSSKAPQQAALQSQKDDT